jgi:flavin reductase (DIM6/NTAB) family NADH-FMN oxidoreductase RutF
MMYQSFSPNDLPVPKLHGLLLGSIAPRPIAFVSTVDKDGKPNLSPYSFFNVFGANPPLAIISPARRVRDNTTKHTLENAEETGELVINVVSYAMVHQASLASVEYPKGINEFIKAGFTPLPSLTVTPPRVAESPVQLECQVDDIYYSGKDGGAGNLIRCRIKQIHINTSVLDENGRIDQHKIDLVGRLGGDYYVRASGNALFTVPKPVSSLGIGIDQLPQYIKNSPHLSGAELGRLGNLESLPDSKTSILFIQSEEFKNLLASRNISSSLSPLQLAKKLLSLDEAYPALCLLIANPQNGL